MNPLSWVLVTVLSVVLLTGLLALVAWRILRGEMKMHQDQFLQLAREQFSAEQSKAAVEWETRKQAVESSVQGLKEELERYRQIIHDLEKDRDTKYGNLESEIKNASQTTMKLHDATQHLNSILGNVKLRGQWGERMAEDIIRYSGLIEGVNYIKQKTMEQGSTKPDFTFLLPGDFKINMDVKFPLDNYMKMVNAEQPADRERHEKDFFQNVKDRIRELQNREYINPVANTLDFVLLFIPNEQVFGMIQEKMPALLDTALGQKVVLCSPFTLFAMLSIIRKAHENFRYEKDIKKIIVLVEQFSKIYTRFKERFDDIGRSLEKLESQYRGVRDKSFHQLDTKIRHIEDYKKGRPRVTIEAPEVPSLEAPNDNHDDQPVA